MPPMASVVYERVQRPVMNVGLTESPAEPRE
jgi:hypothetical protein